jgi:hypothetical protein
VRELAPGRGGLAVVAIVAVIVVALVVVLAVGLGGPGAPGGAGGSSPGSSGSTATGTGGAATGQVGGSSSPVAGGGPTTIPVVTPSSSAAVGSSAAPGSSAAASTGPIPAFRHVYVIVMENREYGSIVGNPAASYVNQLIDRYGLAAAYTAVAHPSEPNYLALFSGSTHGIRDDGVHDLSGRNLADQLEEHGRTWRVFAENVPGGCFTRAVAHGGPDGIGTYARKHEPAISFTDISGDPARCAAIRPFDDFSPSAADFELIVPNMCHDGHDCSTAQADAFLHGFVPRILDSPAMDDGVIFLTWDEGTTGAGGGGRVATVVIGPSVRPGFRSTVSHSHYSLLRTIQAAWRLGCLNESCQANDLREFFR